MGKYQQYTECEDSGVEWLGKIPKHWSVKKLKFLSSIKPSNVDKKTKEDELPVRLCNYTDVYYNENISASLPFMKATATDEQIKKFTLIAGDTIITKDSEDPSDIAVPAYVPEDLPGIVCGYHLAMIRPKDPDMGWYTKRVFETDYARSYFSTRANGLTRYGLGTYPLSNIFFPIPPKEEAQNIAAFLDHETAKIGQLTAKQGRLIELLKEKRQAVISHAVTKGLNPDVPMKDSGVEWLGAIPAHWERVPLKRLVSIPIIGGPHETPEKRDDGVPFISAEAVSKGFVNFDKKWGHISREDQRRFSKRYSPRKGDILVIKLGATTGVSAIVETDQEFNVWVPLAAIRCNKLAMPRFVLCALRSSSVQDAIKISWTYGTQQTLGLNTLENMYIPLPPKDEQQEIVEHIGHFEGRIEELLAKSSNSVGLLREHRAALISAAVTGKIDVRGWKKPDTEPEETATAVSA